MKPVLKTLVSALLCAFFVVSTAIHATAIDIQEVVSKQGIKSLLVEDYTLPIIALSFSFKGGSTQDKAGKEGTIRLMTALMDEGAGDMDSATYRAKLEEFGIELGFSSSQDRFGGGMRTIVSEKENAFRLLKLALTEPRFDDVATERLRAGLLKSIRRSQTNPSYVSRKMLRELLFA
ncbi:MAG: insulinase family protein, partial [Pseudomonadota bacterium]